MSYRKVPLTQLSPHTRGQSKNLLRNTLIFSDDNMMSTRSVKVLVVSADRLDLMKE